jgi:hypothetical protein
MAPANSDLGEIGKGWRGGEMGNRGGDGVTARSLWFFDILFMSKYMELMSQLKIYDI